MKFFIYVITLFFIINTNINAEDAKEEQVKVAYVYNFLKNISWQNENKITKYVEDSCCSMSLAEAFL